MDQRENNVASGMELTKNPHKMKTPPVARYTAFTYAKRVMGNGLKRITPTPLFPFKAYILKVSEPL